MYSNPKYLQGNSNNVISVKFSVYRTRKLISRCNASNNIVNTELGSRLKKTVIFTKSYFVFCCNLWVNI